MNCLHASHELPRHPLTAIQLYHPQMAHPQVVRVRDDADKVYAADSRWHGAEDHEKAFAISVLAKITGMEFPVLNADHDTAMDTLFYNILIRPKITTMNMWTGPQTVGAAFIPADYCEPVRSGFWSAS